MKTSNIAKLVFAIIICELAGAIGSIFTTPSIGTWYATLVRPSFSPPNWIFAPVWTILFALMGIALFLVWKNISSRSDDGREKKVAIQVFVAQLCLNVMWSIIFFGLHSPGGALILIASLWMTIVATMLSFYKVSKAASFLLLPYFIWVSFAGILNFAIWYIN
jgi:tryptophan-rich sensory protein